MDIGSKIKNARNKAGFTQEQTAESLGVSRQTISNWENGKTYPDIVSVVRMSELYDISLDHLLKEEEPMSDYLDYLEESTNTVKSRRRLGGIILAAVYIGIWAAAVIAFWFLGSGSDAMGYSLVYLWILMPVTTFVVSLLIGKMITWESGNGFPSSHSESCICFPNTLLSARQIWRHLIRSTFQSWG